MFHLKISNTFFPIFCTTKPFFLNLNFYYCVYYLQSYSHTLNNTYTLIRHSPFFLGGSVWTRHTWFPWKNLVVNAGGQSSISELIVLPNVQYANLIVLRYHRWNVMLSGASWLYTYLCDPPTKHEYVGLRFWWVGHSSHHSINRIQSWCKVLVKNSLKK